jgi:cell division protein FtsB
MIVIDIRYIVSRLAFTLEIIIFAAIYLCGSDGFAQLKQLKTDCIELNEAIVCKQREVEQIEQRIIAWNVHPFYKEKMAREQLQMSHDGDVIYFIESAKQVQA